MKFLIFKFIQRTLCLQIHVCKGEFRTYFGGNNCGVWCRCLIVLLAVLSSCKEKEDPDNQLISDNAESGIVFVEHEDSGFNFKIETNNPAKFFRCATKPSFDIGENGQAAISLAQGIYWVDVHWENGQPLKETIPVVIAKNVNYARKALLKLKSMKNGAGNHALIFRHANASVGVDKPETGGPDWWKSCDPNLARQLSTLGIDRSKRIGQILKKLQVPVKVAISSEFCRAVQTIELMEIGIPIKLDHRLNHENANPVFENYSIVLDALRENASGDGLLIASGHYNIYENNPFRSIVRPFDMTDAFLVKVNPTGDPELVGSVPYFFWALFED